MGSMEFETPPTRMSLIELPGSDIQREGILKKLKTNRKKYFVLRSTSSSGPARLEYYDSEKKLKLGHPPKRSIKLHTCFNINKKSDTRQKFAIALYTKDECFSVLADNSVEQDLWLNLLLKLQSEFIPEGDAPRPHYDHVWQVCVKPKGLGISRAICGDFRLCLSDTEICMVKKNSDQPEYTFQLGSIRRCGNTDNFFFIEVGRHSPIGPGEIYMQLEDNFCAQNIHEEILSHMRKNTSSGDGFRQRSSTSTSTLRRTREGRESDSELTSVRQRTHSESKKPAGPRKLLQSQRPQSVATLPSGSKSPSSDFNIMNSHYANVPSTFSMRDRSDSASSRASSHKSLPPEAYGSSPEPVSFNRSMTPDTVTSMTEGSQSSYMDMSPGQTSTAVVENTQYLAMSPGQQSAKSPNFPQIQHGRSSSLPVSQSISRPEEERSYVAMSPGQSSQEITGSSYMEMSPRQHSVPLPSFPSPQSGTPTSGQNTGQQSSPFTPLNQKVPKPDTPPSQRNSRPGSSCSQDSSVHSSEGYMEMNPAEQSKSSEKVNIVPEQGYIDMTVGSSSSTSSKDGSPKLSRTAPITIRSTKPSTYLEMTPSSQPLAPVREGGSGEGYLPMSPQYNSPHGDGFPKPNKVVSYLSDDSMSEFPKRAYSVGSRPPRKIVPPHLHHLPVAKPNMSNNGRSSSAPHLIEKKLRNMVPYTQMDSSLSCSPSQSVKSSVSDSDSFVEMEYMRPRTSSDSWGCRPRSSSFGKIFMQGHRPRSSSYGTSARGKLGSYESVRLTSKELHIKQSNESLADQMSGASSSESLKKLDSQQKLGKKSEYVDMRLDKSETPGYIDMTMNPKSIGSKSSSSLSSSPAVGLTSPPRQDATSSPSIKIIKPSGTQKSIGFSTPTNSTLDSIPPQSSLFSPISFVSPVGSRSPSVKGRSPASSGRESEEENYLPYQPPSSGKEEKKSDHKKEKKSWHSKSKHKDKKHSEEKDKKHGHKGSDPSHKSSDNVPGINVQEMKNDRDSMYMDFQPGALEDTRTGTPFFSLDFEISQDSLCSEQSINTCKKPTGDTSPYMEYEPENMSSKTDSDEKCSELSDDSGYMQYEPGRVEQIKNTGEPVQPSIELTPSPQQVVPKVPPRKTESLDLKGEVRSCCEYESGGSSIETVKDNGSATHVELDPYMDFDPDNPSKETGSMKTPSRVRSFITDTSMEDELGKDSISVKKSVSDSKDNDSFKNLNKSDLSEYSSDEKSVKIKSIINQPDLPSTEAESDEYVGLDFTNKSSERFLLGGVTTGFQNAVTQDRVVDNKNRKMNENLSKNEQVKCENVEKTASSNSKNVNDKLKGSISSLVELKIEESSTDSKLDKNRKLSSSTKASVSPKELTKKVSLPCMNLPADISEMAKKEIEETDNNSGKSRNSCSDLTFSYEPMNFPSDTLTSDLSVSQQQITTTPGLNYASLDLGSRENIDSADTKPHTVKSRHASTTEDSGPLPPNSYAQIDFKMSENLKNSGKLAENLKSSGKQDL